MIALLAAAVAASAGAAPAALDLAFKNTIVSTYPDGRTARLWMEPNGAYRGQGRTGRFSSGRWTLKGDQVCLKQTRPFPYPFSYCTAVPAGAVGAAWSGKAVTGEPIRIKLVEGR